MVIWLLLLGVISGLAVAFPIVGMGTLVIVWWWLVRDCEGE
jgi:hypothetical protein